MVTGCDIADLKIGWMEMVVERMYRDEQGQRCADVEIQASHDLNLYDRQGGNDR